jgi:hypothetical protein
MRIDKGLYEEINEYCELNGLRTRDFIHKILKEAFLIQKYGTSPFARGERVNPQSEESDLNTPVTDVNVETAHINACAEMMVSYGEDLPSAHEEGGGMKFHQSEDMKKEIKKKRKLK